MAFLEASARGYDNGFEGEARRLATTIRTVVHDTPRSQSILGQLGIKDQLRFIDTAERMNPRNLLPTPGLVMGRVEVGVEGRYVPPLDNLSPPRRNPPKPFEAWWGDAVTKDADGNLFSRGTYVLTTANKEGGAHVDPTLDASYAALSRGNKLGWFYEASDRSEPFQGNLALASVRQIAFEVERTLRKQLAHLL